MRTLEIDSFLTPEDHFFIARSRFEAGQLLSEHTHKDFVELFWVESGMGVHEVNGEKQDLNTNDLVLVRQNDSHAFRGAAKSHLSILNLAFRSDVLEHLSVRYGIEEGNYFWSGAKLPYSVKLRQNQVEWINSEVNKLMHLPRSLMELDRFLLNLFSNIMHSSVVTLPSGMPSWLSDAMIQIKEPENFTGGASSFVRLTGKTKEHVNRTTRKVLDRTVTEIVNEARMHYAAWLLRMTKRTLMEVSVDCGFESLSYFYRTFKKANGLTPRDYRKKYQEEIF